jgi:putative transposase
MKSPYDKNRYRKGAHTVLDLQYHFVWKTKYGYSVLNGDLAARARDILREICSQYDITISRGNVRSNHIHILVSAPSHMSVAKIAQLLKGKSSYLLQKCFPELKKRYWGQHIWSRGYFCATVGAVTEDTVKQYIENQSDIPDTFKVWDEGVLPEPSGTCL